MSHQSRPEDTQTRLSPQQLGSSIAPKKEGNSPGQQGHGSPATSSLPSVTSLPNYSGQAGPAPGSLESGSPALSRSIGVHSILNPSGEQHLSNVQRPIQSPGRSASIAYGSQPHPSMSPRSRKRGDRSSPVHERPPGLDNRQNRRILTPKSPRAVSHGQIPPSAGPVARYPPVSHEGRVYTAEPDTNRGGVVIPPLPPMSAAQPNTLPALQAAESSAGFSRSGPGGPVAPYTSAGGTPRGPGSPEMPHSTFDRKPGSPFRPLAPESSGFPPGGRAPQRTYSSQQGYHLNLPNEPLHVSIDFNQASKLADEKRKRNAGASARFRQRRKEKEQAASQAITDLQRRLRDAEEDRDFYMMERNYFRDLLARTIGSAQMPTRPSSPHLRRLHAPSAPIEAPTNLDYGQREGSESAPSQRRRTGEYHPSLPSASPMGPAPYPSYAPPPPPPSQSHYALPPPTGPGTIMDPRTQQSSLPPNQPPSQDPFRRDMLR